MKKGANGVQKPLYRKLKMRGKLSRQNIGGKIWIVGLEPHRWMSGAPPLDVWSVTQPKVLNDVSQVSKCQKPL